jgi:hypothetical protein
LSSCGHFTALTGIPIVRHYLKIQEIGNRRLEMGLIEKRGKMRGFEREDGGLKPEARI